MFNIIQNHIKYVIALLLATTIVVILAIYFIWPNHIEDDDSYLNIPEGFLLGAGTSACQIEGAWNIDGKTESELDYKLHSNGAAFPGNLDVASDSYHHYLEDIKALKYMGVDVYRFSLSWPRLFPTGYNNIVNQKGVEYYHKIFDELEKNNISALVTLYHFDHPNVFREFGGWTNEKMIDIFADYARFIFKEFGPRVKIFTTINEPLIVSLFCQTDWLRKMDIHHRNDSAGQICLHNLLKAHARAYHIYDEEFRAKQNGLIGVALNCDHGYPEDPNDHESADIMFEYTCGWFAQPIFSKRGDYPEIMKKRIEENSRNEGLKQSRLPQFSKKWIDYIRGTSDYLGLNHYNTYSLKVMPKINNTFWYNDIGIFLHLDPKHLITYPTNITVMPNGIRELLIKIRDKYDNPMVLICEGGFPTINDIYDYSRIRYLYTFMERVLYAAKYDKCNVKSYIVWSLIDSFEFLSNYTYSYGLVHVDFKDPKRKRILKASATWLKNVISKRRLYFDIYEEFKAVKL